MKALLSWSGTHKAVGAPEALDHAGVGADPNGQLLGCGRLGAGGDSVVGLSVDQVMHEFGSFQTHLPERPAFWRRCGRRTCRAFNQELVRAP